MNLNTIERVVPDVLYYRGLEYFEAGLVEELREIGTGFWEAEVAGTELYDVSVQIDSAGNILSTFCSCPYESATLCKHEVAVCLAISEYKEGNGTDAAVSVDVFAKLKGLKKAELLEILNELTQTQPDVRSFLLKRFSREAGMDEEAARRIIRQAAKRASRRGFIGWDEAAEVAEGALEVLDYAETLEPERDSEKILRLCVTVIDECGELLEMADDSDGHIADTIYDALNKIDKVMQGWPNQPDKVTVDRLLTLFRPVMLRHLELGMTEVPEFLGELLVEMAEDDVVTRKIYGFMETIIASDEMQNKSYHYDEENFRCLQLELLYQLEDRKAILAFMQSHRTFPEIRKAEIRQALREKEYEKAILLCEESERLDAALPGLVSDWRKLRLEAYKGAGRKQEALGLMYAFAVKGDEAYYRELKAAADPENWPELLQSLLEDMQKEPWGHSLYISILIEENMTAELLANCEARNYDIETLYPYLIEAYPQEVTEIFTTYIHNLIHSASDRKRYREACGKIRIYRKALGAEAATSLVEELKFLYPRRPALLDELSKV